MNTLFTIIFYAISTFYFFKLTKYFITPKKSLIHKIILGVGLCIIVNVVIFTNDIVNISYMITAFLIITIFCYDGKFIEKLSTVMILYPIIVIINFITNDLAYQIYVRYIQHFNNYILNSIIEATYLAICSIFWYCLYVFYKNKLTNSFKLIDIKTWILIDIICLAPLASIYFAIIFTPIGMGYTIYPMAIACLITNIGILFLVDYISLSIKPKIENQNLKLEYSYYKQIEANQKELKKLHHDIKNHLNIIYQFVESNNIIDAKSYLESILVKFKYNNKIFCKNNTINAVINTKYNSAIENKIDCFFNLDIDNAISISDVDLCSLFSNTLDNAISASKKTNDISKRKITLKARCHNGFFSFNIENNHSNNIKIENDKYISDKNDSMHGFGIENIKDIINKYKGHIQISHNENIFSIIIIIKVYNNI